MEPIKLVQTNMITRKGYYTCTVTRLSERNHRDRPLLIVHFKVAKGKCKGFSLSAGFYYKEPKGKARLTHLCNAVGITRKLENPEQLLGRTLRARVVPKITEREGRKYWNHIITRFHKIQQD